MRIALVLAGCLLLGSAAAQDPVESKPAPQDAQEKVSAADRMKELEALQQKAYTDWRASIKKSREEAEKPADGKKGKQIKAMAMRPDYSEVAKKAAGFATEFAGTDDAVQFLMMVVQAGTDTEQKRSAINTMLDNHIDSPELAKMGGMLEYLEQMIDGEIAAKAKKCMLASKNADVRGWALFATHKGAVESADRAGEEYADAKSKLLAAAGEVSDKRLAQEIRGAIDMREKFGVGCEAPDIAGIDLDGVEFKLSDYKGKVIFLDFWGDW